MKTRTKQALLAALVVCLWIPLAVKYGGGGHRGACGFRPTTHQLLGIIGQHMG